VEESEIIRKKNYVGFAEVYRNKCEKSLSLLEGKREIDKELYAELVKLDTRLGLQTITI